VRKISLIFGLLSGVLSAGLLIATIPYVNSVNYRRGDVLGYTSIALSALLMFSGVRSYRENSSGGRLSFGRGLAVGLLIALISSACHVITFSGSLFQSVSELGRQVHGLHDSEGEGFRRERSKDPANSRAGRRLKRLCDKPATNAAVAFAEALPVGAFAAVLSAAILRRREISSEN